MSSFQEKLLSVLGRNIAEIEVWELMAEFQLVDVYDDPPFRQYIGSDEKGVDLLFENDKIIDVQIHVRGTATRGAFLGELPFGLKSGMTQVEVHDLL